MANTRKKSSPAVAPTPKPARPAPKAKRTRKPAVELAKRLAGLIAKKVDALTRNTNRWRGNAQPDQFEAIRRITAALAVLGDAANEIAADIAFLADSGFAPATGTPGRKPMFAPGAKVAIKPNKYDASAHGATNVFDVVALTEKYIQIRLSGIARAATFPVPRKWLMLLDAAEDEVETASTAGGDDVGLVDDNPDEETQDDVVDEDTESSSDDDL